MYESSWPCFYHGLSTSNACIIPRNQFQRRQADSTSCLIPSFVARFIKGRHLSKCKGSAEVRVTKYVRRVKCKHQSIFRFSMFCEPPIHARSLIEKQFEENSHFIRHTKTIQRLHRSWFKYCETNPAELEELSYPFVICGQKHTITQVS
jgi:hypothetical protein